MSELMNWLERAAGTAALADAQRRWSEFSTREQPVVTLFGAYDTGKTSIIRRLLRERGRAIPDSLTVSARHETFETTLVDFDGVLIRDTPGISPEGTDIRAESNSQAARDAAARTDVLVVVLNPQLLTGERRELVRIFDDVWPQGSLWFVISRADEGGADPIADPEGFGAWSERKKAELEASLPVVACRPVFVVVPDYGGIQDEDLWATTRDWDGMDQLAAMLDALGTVNRECLREAAAVRFWAGEVRGLVSEIKRGLPDLETAQQTAELSSRRRQGFDSQLEGVRLGAQAALEAAINESVRTLLLTGGTSADAIESATEGELEKWWLAQQTELRRVRGEAIATLDSQQSSAGWRVLQGVYRSVDDGLTTRSGETRQAASVLGVLLDKTHQAGSGIQDLLKASEALRRPTQARRLLENGAEVAGGAATWADRVTIGIGILDAAAPLIEWAAQAYDEHREVERRRKARAHVEAEVSKIAKQVGELAMARLDLAISSLRDEIAANTVDPELADKLRGELERLRAIADEGESLVSERTA